MQINKRTYLCHRVSYLAHYGIDPLDLCVMHDCDNPTCFNPEHLILGTKAENNHDRNAKNRQARQKGVVHGMAKLTETQVLEIRKMARDTSLIHSDIGDIFGVTQTMVSNIVRGKNWSHLPI